MIYGKSEDLDLAKKIRRKYHRILEKLRVRSTYHGDRKAALDIIKKMTEYNSALRAIGYRIKDELEPGRCKLVPITQEWANAELAKQTRIEKLTEMTRNPNLSDEERTVLIRQIVSGLANGEK